MTEISQEEKTFILDTYKLWKEAPQQITPETNVKLRELKEILYQYRQDKNNPIQKMQESFDLQQKTHEMLGFKLMDEKFRPKEKSSFAGKSWTATKEQRAKNCDDAIEYLKNKLKVWDALSPFEQALAVTKIWGTVKQ